MSVLFQKINPVIPRYYQKILHAICQLLAHFHPDSLDQCLLTHRFHDSAGAKNRDAAHDTKTRIKGLSCQFFSLWNGNDCFQTTLPAIFFADSLQIFPDHLPGYFVDCRCSHRLFQSRFCDTADASAAVNQNPFSPCLQFICRNPGHFRIDQNAVGHIRVIPTILPDRAGDRCFRAMDFQHFQPKGNAFWRHQFHIRDLFP